MLISFALFMCLFPPEKTGLSAHRKARQTRNTAAPLLWLFLALSLPGCCEEVSGGLLDQRLSSWWMKTGLPRCHIVDDTLGLHFLCLYKSTINIRSHNFCFKTCGTDLLGVPQGLGIKAKEDKRTKRTAISLTLAFQGQPRPRGLQDLSEGDCSSGESSPTLLSRTLAGTFGARAWPRQWALCTEDGPW